MRDQVRKRMQLIGDRFADEATKLVLVEVDKLVARLDHAIDTALSAFLSDTKSDLSTTAASAVEDSPRPTKRSKGRPRPASAQALAPAGNVAEPHRVPSGHRGADAAVVDLSEPHKRTNTCRKCGAIGFTARTCGKTHNVSTSPAEEEHGEEATTLPAKKHRASAQPPATSSISIASPPLYSHAPRSFRSHRSARREAPSSRRTFHPRVGRRRWIERRSGPPWAN
jgi:hypothetical protein